MPTFKHHYYKPKPTQCEKDLAYLMKTVNISLPVDIFVRDYTSVEYMNQEYLHLIALVYQEARGEPVEGIKAVCDVVANRLSQGLSYFGDTYFDVIYQSKNHEYQFDGMNPLKDHYNNLKNPKIEELSKIIKPVLEAYIEPNTVLTDKRVCYYKRIDSEFGDWGKRLQLYKVIGEHDFWFDPQLSK